MERRLGPLLYLRKPLLLSSESQSCRQRVSGRLPLLRVQRSMLKSHNHRYTPDLFPSYAVFATAIVSQNDFLPKERELAVLAVTAVHDVPYMRYAHTRMALGMGLTKEQVAMMVKGVQPKGLTEEENIIYATALELAETKTPVKEETWQRAEALLGKARCARLAQTVGLYLYTGSLLRLGAVSAPDN